MTAKVYTIAEIQCWEVENETISDEENAQEFITFYHNQIRIAKRDLQVAEQGLAEWQSRMAKIKAAVKNCPDCGKTISEKICIGDGADCANHSCGTSSMCCQCNYDYAMSQI